MTAITTTTSALPDKASLHRESQPSRKPFPPSVSEEEAKTRFVSSLSNGVDTLLDLGHGRDRASAELLNEIADGCSPNEDEVGHFLFFAVGFS
mmetsp:Transcript_27310/g.51602  ORF Transcript_27310/g.51602 Transcript_27310/m.51602 type:complete len:93 (-) Transcript_27310:1015-1293(-)